jgi:hypothetical protein
MGTMDLEKHQLQCPGCSRPIEATYTDICSRHEIKCGQCGSSIKFDSYSGSHIHYILAEVERANEKLAKAIQEAAKKAELVIKK